MLEGKTRIPQDEMSPRIREFTPSDFLKAAQ
jgi:hypothetical protein